MEGFAMKLGLILAMTFLGFSIASAQDTNELETLSASPEAKSVDQKKTDTELSLPENTATTSIGKSSSPGSGFGAKPKENVGAILDFEGEVIEGERRRPDLFLQISIDNIKFDSLIYNRDDFNDYLEVDRKSRTRFLKMK
jgi:hypothetical protein